MFYCVYGQMYEIKNYYYYYYYCISFKKSLKEYLLSNILVNNYPK